MLTSLQPILAASMVRSTILDAPNGTACTPLTQSHIGSQKQTRAAQHMAAHAATQINL